MATRSSICIEFVLMFAEIFISSVALISTSQGFHKVMEGIEKAIEMGYNPVKVF